MANIKSNLRNIWNYIKHHQQWLGFLMILAALTYAYITVLFEPRETFLDITYALLFALFMFGLVNTFIKDRDFASKINFKTWEIPLLMGGVFATYSLVHFADVPVVLASCVVGLIGHFFIKEFETSIYCGSFAGMVSVALFNFSEVFVLSLVCAFIYIFTKPIFKGYGGKLGTIAFVSSLIVHSIFKDQFLVIDLDLHTGLLLITTVLGVFTTYYLQHKFYQTAVFASAMTSFVFAVVFIYLIPSHIDYVIVFFAASFIGMSSKERIPNLLAVIISGLVLGFVFDVFIELFNGLGGKLGLTAMISVMISSGIIKLLDITIFKKCLNTK